MDLESALRRPALHALVDAFVPADEHPSAWEAGTADFLRQLALTERRDLADTLHAGLDLVEAAGGAGDPDALVADSGALGTFARLVRSLTLQAYYGHPAAGGNQDAVSWSMVGYRPGPYDRTDWPASTTNSDPSGTIDDAASHYDAVVVGLGAGGGVTACLLAEAGHRVLAVERGDWLSGPEVFEDHLRSHRALHGYDQFAGPPSAGNPRVHHERVVTPLDGGWNNNAMTVGGGTRVYGAQAWRFVPEDFAMARTYGVPEGSSLADWPISYDDLEPYYDRAEWEIGVSGSPEGFVGGGPRRRDYPMPPLPENLSGALLSTGAERLGWVTGRVPLLINSRPYGGRPACAACGECVGFGCRVEAKNGSHNALLPRALATGNCDVITRTRVERIVTDDAGRVRGVALAAEPDGRTRRTVTADQVFVAAGAIETARLLQLSTSAQEPRGLGNQHDQVGRHLQGHTYAGAIGIFDEVVQDCRGPGVTIATHEFRHHNDGLVGGGMLANDFVPTPLSTYRLLTGTGLIPAHGAQSKQGMRELYSRMAIVMGPIQDTPNPESRVRLASDTVDALGLPVARLSGWVLDTDRPTAQMMQDRSTEWLSASGATRTAHIGGVGRGPSAGQHQAGTCRMGDDPRTSVVDPSGRVWGHDNLRIVDGSVHVTNGGVNPVLTIFANAYRTTELALRES